MNSEIRTARSSECELLSALAFRSKAHWGYSGEFMEACRAELSITPEYLRQNPVFVLSRAALPVGFYSLERSCATEVEIGHLFIEPSQMGNEFGRRLFVHSCVEAKNRGYRVLVIQSDPHAVDFYTSCGARCLGSRPSASISNRSLPLLEFGLAGV